MQISQPPRPNFHFLVNAGSPEKLVRGETGLFILKKPVQLQGVDPSWVWLAPAARRVRAAKLLAQADG